MLIPCLILITNLSSGEGTKQLMPDSSGSKSCEILIANGNVGGNMRDPFALYNGDTNYRLHIRIKDFTKEKIFFGLGQSNGPYPPNSPVTWRIHKPNGTVVWTGTTPSTVGQVGYISYYSQAYAGPTRIDPNGYNALVYAPTVNGDYFMTFQVSNTQSRTYKQFDVTVIDTTTNTVVEGRVHTKAWQLTTNEIVPNHGYYGYLYVYSKDSLVTKFDPNAMEGMWFTVSCNESGCYPIGPGMPANQARKSTEGWHNYPEYEIFLNDPDSLIYPSGIFGQIVIPPPPTPIVSTISNCNNGTILFIFSVTGTGTVTISLELSSLGPPYIDRPLVQTVNTGQDTIIWDGLDGAVPAHVIPNGAQFPFTLTFINGLTHVPLWDVENNPNGFKVYLTRPTGTADPLFYWDDTGLNPNNGPIPSPSSNFIGCNSLTSTCHSWSGGDPGNNRTINTWYYISNTSTVPVTVIKKQMPGNLGGIIGQNQLCQGANAQYAVTTDPNTTQYCWTYPGGVDTTYTSTLNIFIPANAPTGPGQITVHGLNALCGAGPTSIKNITIEPVPDITNPPNYSICSGTSTAITLTSLPSGATFNWITPPPACSGNIQVCPPGSSSTTQINDLLSVIDLNPGTVMYFVTPVLGICTGTTRNINVTVSPVPNVIINSTTPTICSGQITNIQLSSTVPNTTFSWTASGSSPNVSGFASSGIGNIIETITNSGFTTETVTFAITPSANGCTPVNPTSYTVTVYPIPDLIINSTTPSICSGQSANIQLSSSVTGATFSWTTSASSPNLSGFPANGSGNIIFIITNSGTTVETVTFSITPSANGCSPSAPVNYIVTVYPNPVPSISGPATVCQGLTGSYTTDPNMTNYIWTTSAGGTIIIGSGTNAITVQWTIAGAQTVNVNYTDANGCTATSPTVHMITINPLPVPTITGPNSVCNNSVQTYSTENGMTGYAWNVSAGGTITGGSGTNSIMVHWTVSGTHTVSVNYSNANGCMAVDPVVYNVTIFALPVPTLSGPATMCLNNTGSYTTEPGMTSYLWTITGGTITSGSGTNTIQANWTSTGTQVLSVTYTDGNGCVPAAPTSYNVIINTLPLPTITGVASICVANSTIYITEAGMTSYTWGVSAGGTIIGGAGTNSVTVLWNTAGAQTVSVNYVVATGCTAQVPTVKNITVNPLPAPIITGSNPICEFSMQTYSTPNFAGHNYNWTVTGGIIQSGQGTFLIQVLWGAAGNATINVTETILATSCFASAPVFGVTITPYPLPANIITGSNAVCEASGNVIYSVPPILYATSYNWTYSGTGATIANNGNTISVNFSMGATSGILTVRGVNNCGSGTAANLAITVNPLPVVTFTSCNDPVTTTNAQPFRLKGGIPLGGVYAGAGVAAGIFNPGLAGPGNHVITYTYTNTWACTSNNTHTINVISSFGFVCGNNITDVRDNQQYPTVQIGSQCWAAANLNYGTAVPLSSVQRDNCIPEKYCFNDTPANCTNEGGLYQWDELMQFADASATQGLCAPGWHIPTENDWNILFAFFVNNGFAGSPIKNTGFSGFNAFLWGTGFENSSWSFNNFATMFWTSTMDGPVKAWAHGINSFDPSVSKYPNSRSNAYFVRCIKD